MTYKTDRTNLRKKGNTYQFRKDWRDENGVRKCYIKSLQTSILTIARKRQEEIYGRWNEIVAGDDFSWSWQGQHNRTTLKEKRLDEAVKQYIKHKKANNLAPNSIKLITYSLGRLIDFLGSGYNYNSLNSEDIDAFKIRLSNSITRRNKKRTPAGVNVIIRDVRGFVNWLFHTQRIIRQIPIKQVKEPQRKPKHLTEDDVNKIFSLESLSDQMKRFIGFYLGTGLRRASLFFGHMEGNWLVIPADAPYNKSKREIEKHLDRGLHSIWLEMLEEKDKFKKAGYKFENLVDKITRSFKDAVRECGLSEKLTLHSTRHTFAVVSLLRTNDINLVKEELGHSSVVVTEGYTKHKRSRLSADFPSLMEEIEKAQKTPKLVEGGHLLAVTEGEDRRKTN